MLLFDDRMNIFFASIYAQYIMSSRHFRIFNNLVSSHLSIMNITEEEKHSLKGPQRPPHRTRVSEIGPLLWPQSNIV